MRPLYLMVGFWGERFRSDFTDYCLPSLLAPRNLGSLSADDGHRFLICTTAADWVALQDHPSWGLLVRHALPVHIEVGLPEESSDVAKFKHMTLGHRLLTRYAAQDRALACQIMPDAMYTDGTIETAMRYGARGAHAVLVVALRLNEEGLFAELQGRGLVPPRSAAARSGAPIVLQSRAVVGPSVRNLYYDCVAHDWDSPNFPTWPSFCAWRVPGRAEMLFHSAYFAYILVDFGTVTRHNERSFEAASIENYWLADNFPDPNKIHIVRDSNEAMVVSWTPTPVRPPPSRRRLILRVPILATVWKGFRLRCMREFHVIIGDRHKANNLRHPIRWRSQADDAAWNATEARSHRIMLWFFGDAFGEFTEGVSPAALILLRPWWLILSSGARLSARSGRAFQRSQSTLKQFLHRCRIGRCRA